MKNINLDNCYTFDKVIAIGVINYKNINISDICFYLGYMKNGCSHLYCDNCKVVKQMNKLRRVLYAKH